MSVPGVKKSLILQAPANQENKNNRSKCFLNAIHCRCQSNKKTTKVDQANLNNQSEARTRAHLVADDSLHLLVGGGRRGGQVGVGVTDALGTGQQKAAGSRCGSGERSVLDGELVMPGSH